MMSETMTDSLLLCWKLSYLNYFHLLLFIKNLNFILNVMLHYILVLQFTLWRSETLHFYYLFSFRYTWWLDKIKKMFPLLNADTSTTTIIIIIQWNSIVSVAFHNGDVITTIKLSAFTSTFYEHIEIVNV